MLNFLSFKFFFNFLDKKLKNAISSGKVLNTQKLTKNDITIDKKLLADANKRCKNLQTQLQWNAKTAEVLSIVYQWEVVKTEQGFNCLKL